MKTRIIIADGLAKEGTDKLRALSNVDLQVFDAIDRAKLKELLVDTDILIVRSRTQVDRDLLSSARKLKLAIRAGIGLDNIDVPASTENGTVVMNAPTGNIVTTAEHTLAMLFAVSRHIPQADSTLKQGKWEKKKFQGNEVRGKVLGLIGLGNIGKAVAERAVGLGMLVVGHDPYLSAEAAAKHHVRLLPLEEVLANADYISVHVPLTSATKHLLGKENLKRMKKGAYLINCARGGIVDEAALIECLDQEHLTGAALDVFETEPLPEGHPLTKRTDVVLTPHLGASTDEAQVQVSLEVAEQVAQYLHDGALKNAVNVPNVTLEQLELLKPYINLCEKLGSFAAQIAPSQSISRVRVRYEGTVSTYNREILTLSVLKGLLSPLLTTPVNFVNARTLLKERGIRVEESFAAECRDYASLIELMLEGKNLTLTCSGTIFGKDEPRVVRIDDFAIDAVPEGYLLYTRNTDLPGVIGSMGSIIGSQGVNIARMHLGRDRKKNEAIALINVDSEIPAAGIDQLRGTKGMLLVKQVRV